MIDIMNEILSPITEDDEEEEEEEDSVHTEKDGTDGGK